VYETFLIERSGPIATVTFNRPEKLNPIDEQVTRELLTITHELQNDEQTRIVILTGAGRAFCVGGDMQMFAEAVDPAYQRTQSDTAKLRLEKMGRRLMDEWEQLDQVTIAAINGFAVGGGFALATACDFRIAAAETRMWVSEVALGMPLMWGANTRLINLVGMGKAKEIVMLCDAVTTEEALTLGLVNQVVPLEQLHEATLAFADKLLSKPPMALRRTKEFFAALSTNRAGDITFADAHLGLATLASEDMQEAIAAFREQRNGKFCNR
jgi:enoyl-CoA hydratase